MATSTPQPEKTVTSPLGMLEDLDDREAVRRWLPRLKVGPEASGALAWEEVVGAWDKDDEDARP